VWDHLDFLSDGGFAPGAGPCGGDFIFGIFLEVLYPPARISGSGSDARFSRSPFIYSSSSGNENEFRYFDSLLDEDFDPGAGPFGGEYDLGIDFEVL